MEMGDRLHLALPSLLRGWKGQRESPPLGGARMCTSWSARAAMAVAGEQEVLQWTNGRLWALQAGPGLAGAPVTMNDRNRA